MRYPDLDDDAFAHAYPLELFELLDEMRPVAGSQQRSGVGGAVAVYA